jgi:SAM-dependent methyltransferase
MRFMTNTSAPVGRRPGREQAHLMSGSKKTLVRTFGALDVGRRVRARAIATALAQLPVPDRILDYGCGRGINTMLLARAYPSAEVLGVDIDSDSIEWARQCAESEGITNVEFRCKAEDEEPPAADLVLNVDVLEHVEDDSAFVRRLVSLVRRNGSLLIHTPLAGQRYFFRSVQQAALDEVSAGKGPHLREGYVAAQLETLVSPYFATVNSRHTICGISALAADLDALGAAKNAPWVRLGSIVLLPFPSWGAGMAAKGLLVIGRDRQGGPPS